MTPASFAVSAPRLEVHEVESGAIRLDGFAIAFLASGTARLALPDGERARLAQGDALVVPPEATCEAGGVRSRGELVVLGVPGAWLRAALALGGADALRARSGLGALSGIAVERGGTPVARRAARLLRELAAGPAAPGAPTPLRVASRILELVDVAGEARAGILQPARAGRASLARERLREVLARLRAEPLEGLTLPVLARRLGLSERQASRVFRTELATTFRDWSGEVRLERACALLRESELPITDVAAETGWSSLAHFHTVFRRREGCTPSAYRARRRAERHA